MENKLLIELHAALVSALGKSKADQALKDHMYCILNDLLEANQLTDDGINSALKKELEFTKQAISKKDQAS